MCCFDGSPGRVDQIIANVKEAIVDVFSKSLIISKVSAGEIWVLNALGLSVGAAAKLSMIITKWEKPCCGRFKLNADWLLQRESRSNWWREFVEKPRRKVDVGYG